MKKIFLVLLTTLVMLSCTHKNNVIDTPVPEDINDLRTVETATLISLAEDHFSKKEYPQCGELLQAVLKREPGNYKAGLLKGRLLTALSEYDEAIQIFKGLLRSFSHKYELHYYMGRTYELRQLYSQALARHLKSYELGNNNKFIAEKITDLYMRNQKYSDSITFFHDYLADHPDNNYIRYNLAMSYFYTNNYNNAVDQLKLIKRYDPEYSLAYYGAGFVYYNIFKRSKSDSHRNESVSNLKHYLEAEKNDSYHLSRARRMLNELGY